MDDRQGGPWKIPQLVGTVSENGGANTSLVIEVLRSVHSFLQPHHETPFLVTCTTNSSGIEYWALTSMRSDASQPKEKSSCCVTVLGAPRRLVRRNVGCTSAQPWKARCTASRQADC